MSITTGQEPQSPDECDLVMQGGVTSGVAYPAAVLRLHERYRFRSIGGSSVGAMAAAITAAAEYAREDGGFARLEVLRGELGKPGIIASLLQPYRDTAPILRLFLAIQAKRTLGAKVIGSLVVLLRYSVVPVSLALVIALLFSSVFLNAGRGNFSELGIVGWAPLVIALLVALAIGLLGSAAVLICRAFRALPKHYFGLCSGLTVKGGSPALTNWLYEKIQYVAGKELEDPLTFADLAAQGINLQLMTTDVSAGMPLRTPSCCNEGEILFSVSELAELLPSTVLNYLDQTCPVVQSATPSSPELKAMPEDNLPIIVATRISLAFPVLLSAVPLWRLQNGIATRHWFADGGISSNFPIQFFDEWLPTRPTFGLYFQNPQKDFFGLAGYLGKVVQAATNWHDIAQADLPGFRERVRPIVLAEGQGGFNLTMSAHQLGQLAEDGARAGESLVGFDFPQHWLERYLLLMRMMQRGLVSPEPGRVSVAEAYDAYRHWLANGAQGVKLPSNLDQEWCYEAAIATDSLLESADQWLPTKGSFIMGPDPQPPVVMRITPDV